MPATIREFLWGPVRVFEASGVEEAVELAHQMKREGHYDWFRGQVCDWPPHSSLFRVNQCEDPAQRERVVRRLDLFCKWAGDTPELQYLLAPERVHDLFAILQHYGVPTHYIDFTTDPAVAGFFAADTKKPPADGQSCIYCLDTENLKETWHDIKLAGERERADIELVTIDVRNLWRLQAQRGAFVYATYNWSIDYPLDRIVFPYKGYPAYPTNERIYPEHKSPLEQLLDQYFSVENTTFTNEAIIEMLKGIKARGGHAAFSNWEAWDSGFYPKAFVNSAWLFPLDSWRREVLKGWDVDPAENYFETVGPTLRLNLKQATDPEELKTIVSDGVKQILEGEPGMRSKAVNWQFAGLAVPITVERLNSLFRPAWNGMRRLPYSGDDIADALGSIVALLVVAQTAQVKEDLEVFSQCFGDAVKVAFGYADKSGSRGCVSRARLRGALRRDMEGLLVSEHKQRVADIVELFKIIYNPSLMFEFDAFKRAFAREVIPAQIVFDRSPILFNPARLITFGTP